MTDCALSAYRSCFTPPCKVAVSAFYPHYSRKGRSYPVQVALRFTGSITSSNPSARFVRESDEQVGNVQSCHIDEHFSSLASARLQVVLHLFSYLSTVRRCYPMLSGPDVHPRASCSRDDTSVETTNPSDCEPNAAADTKGTMNTDSLSVHYPLFLDCPFLFSIFGI